MLGCRGSGGKVLGGGLSGFPVVRQEFFEPVDGMSDDAGRHVPEVGEGGEAEHVTSVNLVLTWFCRLG